jgi:hypothetical protein
MRSPNGAGPLDLQTALRGCMFHLQRGVLDSETLVEHVLELLPDAVAVGSRLNEDVRRQGRKAARHGPHVQVVRLDHAVLFGDGAANLAGRNGGGSSFQEDATGLP